ncbi:hypothetical protein [Haladaptatus sp. W1]|nr:hypothetical protein [Haladaptatus sp. W1]
MPISAESRAHSRGSPVHASLLERQTNRSRSLQPLEPRPTTAETAGGGRE